VDTVATAPHPISSEEWIRDSGLGRISDISSSTPNSESAALLTSGPPPDMRLQQVLAPAQESRTICTTCASGGLVFAAPADYPKRSLNFFAILSLSTGGACTTFELLAYVTVAVGKPFTNRLVPLCALPRPSTSQSGRNRVGFFSGHPSWSSSHPRPHWKPCRIKQQV
jgi:hypothetical protein